MGSASRPFDSRPTPTICTSAPITARRSATCCSGSAKGTGFISVTGDIGTGKTTLLRALLRDLEANTIVGLHLQSRPLRPGAAADRQQRVLDSGHLDQQEGARRRAESISRRAEACGEAGRHHRRRGAEPAARRRSSSCGCLSNLETETTKLLQIVLVGQPELKLLLGRPELAQLNQRITVRWHLEPLDRAETARYIAHRLRIAGGPGTGDIFSPGGAPAAVSLLGRRTAPDQHRRASRAARGVHARATHRSVRRSLRHVIAELRTDDAGPRARRYGWLRVAGAAAAALVIGVLAALLLLRPEAPSGRSATDIAAAIATPNDAVPAPPEPTAVATPEAAAAVPVTEATASPVAIETAPPTPARDRDAGRGSADSAGSGSRGPGSRGRRSGGLRHGAALGDRRSDGVLGRARRRSTIMRPRSRRPRAFCANGTVDPLRPDERARHAPGPPDDRQRVVACATSPTSGTLSRLAMMNVPAILEVCAAGERTTAVRARLPAWRAPMSSFDSTSGGRC